MHFSFVHLFRHFSIRHVAVVILAAAACSAVMSCDKDQSGHSGSSQVSSSESTTEIKAETLVIVSNGSELRVGGTALIDKGNGTYAVDSATPNTVWVFRDFNGIHPDQVHTVNGDGVAPGKAYLMTSHGLKLIREVDLKLTNDQIAAQFGIQLPTLPQEAENAFLDGNLQKVRALLNENPNLVSARTAIDNTPLSLAVWRGHKEVAKLLLEKGADVNARTIDGDTPLHGAAESDYMGRNNRNAVAELLLAHGAEVNAKNKYGDTPLHKAVEAGHKDVAELLRKHGGHE